LKSSKGISLLETLVASAILFFLISILLPQLYFVSIERKNLIMQYFAVRVLNERLFETSASGGNSYNEVVLHDGYPYDLEIVVDEDESPRLLYKGCIKWTNLIEKQESICGSVR
jgi:type II secretory pathway pseudopilin PulG